MIIVRVNLQDSVTVRDVVADVVSDVKRNLGADERSRASAWTRIYTFLQLHTQELCVVESGRSWLPA
ncbi:hypothetical protein JOB18_018365 [Solea senegalensis]|uniref:Uncharacterized protein n=1 Tax=Solea senegalensis TaxID=28829 RepID=A0AAV6S6B9_SOLSE|nr:hypothetical protein JOB18_018365 [Solea senegalensis]